MSVLKNIIENQDVYSLAKGFFNAEPTPYQQRIIRSVVFPRKLHTCITAYTRYGKTWSIALATGIYLLLNEGKTVNAVAPVSKQTSKYRDALADFILECPALTERLDMHASGYRRIKKEVSKNRITFKDDNEINILTAGGKNKGQSLMGQGGQLNIVDESCDIDDEVFRKRITRMQEDDPATEGYGQLIEIGNPWKKNHFYKGFQDSDSETFKIDWRIGVKEGRITRSFVNRQYKRLTPLEFLVLYEAEFPDVTERGLFKHSWAEAARQRQAFDFTEDIKVVGVDVAEFGRDQTVVTITYQEGNRVNVEEIKALPQMETMETVDAIDEMLKGYEYLAVDAIGIGAGVASRLRQKGYTVYSVKVSQSSRQDRFRNKKAGYYWKMRNMFEDERIVLPDAPETNKLINELTRIRYERTASGIKILDPEKSPDYADSLMLACCVSHGGGQTGSVRAV